jgi:hypothetical protein
MGECKNVRIEEWINEGVAVSKPRFKMKLGRSPKTEVRRNEEL